MPLGRVLLSRSNVLLTRVSADGNPKYKSGGVMIDTTTIPAAGGTDVTLADGSVIKAGQQYMRYGQIIAKVTVAEIQTITVTATGGTFTATVPGTGVATIATAFNASAATMQANLRTATGNNAITVSLAGGVYTVTFPSAMGDVTLMTLDTSLLTGGSATVATPHAGTQYGKFGPYDPAATDGRANLVRGDCFILDETWLLYPNETPMLSGPNDFIGGVFEAGDVWFDRILQSGVAAHSLAAGPTLAEFETLFPRVSYYKN